MFAMQKHRKASNKKLKQQPQLQRALLEMLETRRLMSAVGPGIATPDYVINPATESPTGPYDSTNSGFVPSQIRAAYGWNNATFYDGHSAVPADGSGQTIAIIDAYDDPDIESDLAVFDSAYGIAAPPSFQVVNQTGNSTNLPAQNAGWDGEISLDVEWSHAMAPGANIMLVEANSASDDLYLAVAYARSVPSVSVISMSFGGSEFFNYDGSIDANSELDYNTLFTTPAGHQGITFIASAGDSGSASLAQFPAVSPNVLSIGGTSLSISTQYGTYGGESAWSGSQAGISAAEFEPGYQEGVQQSGYRYVADVSYLADPYTGFALYDSVAEDGEAGWFPIGGTSAGSPQWAALVAVADQGRTLAGLGTLDGATQTLPALYSVYGAPYTSGYSNYTSYFNDVTTGGGSDVVYKYGGVGYSVYSATIGYDAITGLGSPKVGSIVNLLDGEVAASTPAVSTPAGNTSPAALSSSPLSASITTTLPAYVITGQAGSVRLVLTNTSSDLFAGPVSVTLYASIAGVNDVDITTVNFSKVSLRAGRSVAKMIKFEYPTSLDGTYFVVAYVTENGITTAPATAVSSSAVNIEPPTVDLAVAFAGNSAVAIDPGATNSAIVTITNDGNLTASGTLNLALYASTDAVLDASDTLLTTITPRRIRIGAHRSISFRVTFVSPDDLVGGQFNLISSISSSTSTTDTNTANNTAVVGTFPA